MLIDLSFHSKLISIPFLCPLQPRGSALAEPVPHCTGKAEVWGLFPDASFCCSGRRSERGSPAKTWQNSTPSSSENLALLKPMAWFPPSSAEPGFWLCGGDGEGHENLTKRGGHQAKEEETPCTWVRRGCGGSQVVTEFRSLVSLDVIDKDGRYSHHYWNYLLTRVGKTKCSSFCFSLLSYAIYSYA